VSRKECPVSFLKRCWYVAAWTPDLNPGDLLPVTIAGTDLVLFRDAAGRGVALRDRCPHRFAPLSSGRVENGALRCMYHGLKFAADGSCIEIPGQEIIPSNACVRSYPLVERDDWVWVWLGEPELADPDLIPAGVPLDHPEWASRYGYLDYEASYTLINDNLLDFSHLSFVHAASFGSGPGWASTRPVLTALPRGVRVERWVEDQPRSNSRPDLPPERIDHWSHYDYLVPGVMRSIAHTYPRGTAANHPNGYPPAEVVPISSTITAQAVTPIDEHRCRYFFSRGMLRGDATDERLDRTMEVTQLAFAEDRAMIEAQQKIVEKSGGDHMFVTSADKALLLFRRTMNRLLKAEQAS
jgi:phenylpropionate dioxygenase-like ring-hydroxylating dioxygenase large terminal subunit